MQPHSTSLHPHKEGRGKNQQIPQQHQRWRLIVRKLQHLRKKNLNAHPHRLLQPPLIEEGPKEQPSASLLMTVRRRCNQDLCQERSTRQNKEETAEYQPRFSAPVDKRSIERDSYQRDDKKLVKVKDLKPKRIQGYLEYKFSQRSPALLKYLYLMTSRVVIRVVL
ncbi:hypothetical protein GQ457_01G018920 [Hibiscus cannabinus]